MSVEVKKKVPGLSPQKERAIPAILGSKSLSEAANIVGVTERTIRRWLAEDEHFVREFRVARRQLIEVAIAQLQGSVGEAVDTLRQLLSSDRASVRCRAALGILEHAHKGLEYFELEERLSRLERAQEQTEPPNGRGELAAGVGHEQL